MNRYISFYYQNHTNYFNRYYRYISLERDCDRLDWSMVRAAIKRTARRCQGARKRCGPSACYRL